MHTAYQSKHGTDNSDGPNDHTKATRSWGRHEVREANMPDQQSLRRLSATSASKASHTHKCAVWSTKRNSGIAAQAADALAFRHYLIYTTRCQHTAASHLLPNVRPGTWHNEHHSTRDDILINAIEAVHKACAYGQRDRNPRKPSSCSKRDATAMPCGGIQPH